MGDAYLANHVWGTPGQYVEKMTRIAEAFRAEEFMLAMRYDDMPRDVAARSTDLFACEVMPVIQSLPVQEPLDYEAVVGP